MRSLLREFYKGVDDLQIEILAISQIVILKGEIYKCFLMNSEAKTRGRYVADHGGFVRALCRTYGDTCEMRDQKD